MRGIESQKHQLMNNTLPSRVASTFKRLRILITLCLFLLMGGLEWITYVLATAAGVNIGLSVLMPQRQAAATRWLAFKRAWSEAGRLYVVIIGILAVQAVFEMLYVRKVLLMGGSGAPLMPY